MYPAESFIELSNLDSTHRDAFTRAIQNILRTDLALDVYAQLIDGLPTGDAARDQRIRRTAPSHPVHRHSELCPGSLDKTRRFNDSFTIDELRFESEVSLCDLQS